MTPTPEQIAQWAREAGIDSWWESGNEVKEELDDLLASFAALACAWQAEQDHPFRPSIDENDAIRASVKGNTCQN